MSTTVVIDSLAETADGGSIGDCATQLPLRCLQHNPAVEQRFIDEADADGRTRTTVENDKIRHNALAAFILGIVLTRSSPFNDSGKERTGRIREERKRRVEREKERERESKRERACV